MYIDSTDTNVVVVGFVKLVKDAVSSMYSASGRSAIQVSLCNKGSYSDEYWAFSRRGWRFRTMQKNYLGKTILLAVC